MPISKSVLLYYSSWNHSFTFKRICVSPKRNRYKFMAFAIFVFLHCWIHRNTNSDDADTLLQLIPATIDLDSNLNYTQSFKCNSELRIGRKFRANSVTDQESTVTVRENSEKTQGSKQQSRETQLDRDHGNTLIWNWAVKSRLKVTTPRLCMLVSVDLVSKISLQIWGVDLWGFRFHLQKLVMNPQRKSNSEQEHVKKIWFANGLNSGRRTGAENSRRNFLSFAGISMEKMEYMEREITFLWTRQKRERFLS